MQVSSEVLAVLDRAVIEGSAVKLPDQLDRPDYLAVDKVLRAAGGQWDRAAKAHLFEGDADAAIEAILLTGQVTDTRQEFGAFFSPPSVVARIVALAGLKPAMLVLEPSAGLGAIARAAVARSGIVDCVEIQDRCVLTLRHALPGSRIRHGDFLALAPTPIYDRVLMNPPFARQDDIRHVLHALDFLKPDGRLVAVMSPGIVFRQTSLAQQLRARLAQGSWTIENLPPHSFRESGTDVNAVTLTFEARPV